MRATGSTRGETTVLPAASARSTTRRVSHSLRNGSVTSIVRAATNDGSATIRAAMAADAAARAATGNASRAAIACSRTLRLAARSAAPTGGAGGNGGFGAIGRW